MSSLQFYIIAGAKGKESMAVQAAAESGGNLTLQPFDQTNPLQIWEARPQIGRAGPGTAFVNPATNRCATYNGTRNAVVMQDYMQESIHASSWLMKDVNSSNAFRVAYPKDTSWTWNDKGGKFQPGDIIQMYDDEKSNSLWRWKFITMNYSAVSYDDPCYEWACQQWNDRYTTTPEEIIYCSDTFAIVMALRAASLRNQGFRLRCGRCSYEGFSTLQGGMVIDISDLNVVSVSADRQTVSIGAGARLGDIYKELSQYNVAIPGGTCPVVGISGLTQGGGLGMLLRSDGLLLDSLISLEMVDARGQVLSVSENSHPDLFWACRGGGGGNFGIVTSFNFKLTPIDVPITVFTLTWKWDDFAKALSAWEQWAPESDSRISTLFVLLPKSSGVVTAFGQFKGSPNDLEPLLGLLLRAAPPQDRTSKQYDRYIDAVNAVADLEGPVSRADSTRVKGKTLFIPDHLTAENIERLQYWMEQAPSGAAPTIYALGGAVRKVRPEETAFVHRDARLLIAFQANWTSAADDDAYIKWVRNIYGDIRRTVPNTAYVNIPDRDLGTPEYLRAYYGANLDRLMYVKREYDRGNVFKFEQSIPPGL